MIYEFLADGFEEIEALVPLDLLRRAEIPVRTVGVDGIIVTGSHGVTLHSDFGIDDIDYSDIDGVILPGGPGHRRLRESSALLRCLRIAAEQNKLLAAICAAPSILGTQGYLNGKRACCFPGFEDQLFGAEVLHDPVVTDGNIITSRGAGTALPFALALIAWLASDETARTIAAQIQCP